MGEGLDPEAHRRVQSRYFDELRAVLERHGGTVEKYIGDAVMAVFGTPVVHEDDAPRASRAATEMREVLTALNDELRQGLNVALSVRTGINTGEVAAGDPTTGQRLVTGDAGNVASRLQGAGARRGVLVGRGPLPPVPNPLSGRAGRRARAQGETRADQGLARARRP